MAERKPASPKLRAIASGALLGALVLIAWTQPWFSVELAEGDPLQVGGDVASPALSALALCALALVGALAIAGRFFRVVLGTLQAVLGAVIVLVSVLAIAAPETAVAPAVTEATGLAGAEGLITALGATAWPFLATAAGVLLVVTGVGVVVTSSRWPTTGRRYEATRMEPVETDASPAAAWDALSDGRDPT